MCLFPIPPLFLFVFPPSPNLLCMGRRSMIPYASLVSVLSAPGTSRPNFPPCPTRHSFLRRRGGRRSFFFSLFSVVLTLIGAPLSAFPVHPLLITPRLRFLLLRCLLQWPSHFFILIRCLTLGAQRVTLLRLYGPPRRFFFYPLDSSTIRRCHHKHPTHERQIDPLLRTHVW